MANQAPEKQNRQFESALLRMLPHRYPFLLVDRVTAFTPGVEIQGIKNFTANEAMLLGLFPVVAAGSTGILLEAVTQLGAILVLERPANGRQDRHDSADPLRPAFTRLVCRAIRCALKPAC